MDPMRDKEAKKAADARNKVWEDLVAKVTHGEEAENLLTKVFDELGPYGGGKLSDATIHKLQRFFHFDDSE